MLVHLATVLSFLLNPRIPLWQYCLAAVPIALLPSAALYATASALLEAAGLHIELMQAPARSSTPVEFLSAVVLGPIGETWLLGLTLALFARLSKRPVVVATLAALAWGVLHGLVGWLWFFGTAWSFFVFSCAFLAWRERSYRQAFTAAAATHALLNLAAMLIITAGNAA